MAEIIERLATVEAITIELENRYKNIEADVKEIKDKLLGRPTWAITMMMSSLFALCTGLVLYIITGR